ncbi:MAG: HAMP domain-containing histidine kinase [Bacteroidia bacterium]|nr:HAMP domain-containing histidine kinase [Bacteroidia bacterium]
MLLLSLFISDFDLIGPYSVEAEEGEIFFLINLFSSLIVMVMCVSFIIKVNEESERRLINLTDEVRTKNVSLEKTNAELDRFLYSTSHDLRSPLLSIKGLVNIARHESDPGMIQHYLGMMDERANRLDHFIKDIIDYSKNARTDLRADVVDFARLVDEVCANLEFIEGAKQIRFERDICIAHSAIIDRQRMSIVLNNLIGNAIKYHNVQGEDPWVNIAVSNSDGHVTIKVRDNGQGISHEHLNKIFDMFYRGTDKSKGSGLGLYIVKEAVHKMNGTLEVESQVGEGTTFLVRVPLAEASAEHKPEPIA